VGGGGDSEGKREEKERKRKLSSSRRAETLETQVYHFPVIGVDTSGTRRISGREIYGSGNRSGYQLRGKLYTCCRSCSNTRKSLIFSSLLAKLIALWSRHFSETLPLYRRYYSRKWPFSRLPPFPRAVQPREHFRPTAVSLRTVTPASVTKLRDHRDEMSLFRFSLFPFRELERQFSDSRASHRFSSSRCNSHREATVVSLVLLDDAARYSEMRSIQLIDSLAGNERRVRWIFRRGVAVISTRGIASVGFDD